MEIMKEENGQKQYVVGEWKIKDRQFVHYYYGEMEKNTIDAFSYCVGSILQSEKNTNKCGL